jgi:protein-L-isoaspartate(D-aspartate) O-methyltransferase
MIASFDPRLYASGYERSRQAMVRYQLRARGIRDERVLAAMGEVPRHLFVPDALREIAYADRALPIGFGQTISQPLKTARSLEALELSGSERVLQVGTGSGYQVMLLARLAKEVVSVDIVAALAESARLTLQRLGVDNVSVAVGDGGLGCAGRAPYDAILVNAACAEIPRPLIEQLALGGRLVLPIGDTMRQSLTRIRRQSSGSLSTERLSDCAFVPLLGAYRCLRTG